jgi:Tfp pilus assembly protein PilV
MQKRSCQGLSMLETIIAFFIIVSALLVIAQLFHTSLKHGQITESRLIGATLCDRKLEEIRAWAGDPDNFEGSWVPYDNVTSTYPGFGNYRIRTTLSTPALWTPTSQLESVHPAVNQRTITKSTKGVTVECQWGPNANQTIKLVTLVAAPPRAWSSTLALEITGPGPNPLPRDATATYTVKGYDENNRELEDLTFNWVVVPMEGNGVRASTRRNGKEATIGNWLYGLGGVRIYRPGDVQFTVNARYNGQTATEFVTVNLQ